MLLLIVICLAALFTSGSAGPFKSKVRPVKPIVREAYGSPWPMPQDMFSWPEAIVIDPADFEFVVNVKDCGVLNQAIERYKVLAFINDCSQVKRRPGLFNSQSFGSSQHHRTFESGTLRNLTIDFGHCEEWPTAHMDERYTLRISSRVGNDESYLFANSVWGAIRGLETFSQLVYPLEQFNLFAVNSTLIFDSPRFSHRGFMVDTARHFVPVNILLTQLEAMEFNKMNVFHWHIVDDQSFPYESESFPDLSAKGAYYATHVYSPQDVARVIEFARVRGIRVLVEFDSPGHTLSWGKGLANFLTPCYNAKTKMADGTYGPVDISQESVYFFLQQFFAEVASTFPEQFIHLGGDEVAFKCWQSNPDITKFMQLKAINTYADLESYYLQRVVDIVGGLNKSYIVWQEVFDNGVQLRPDTVVHIWKHDGKWEDEMAKVTGSGFSALLSAPWYLNYVHNPHQKPLDWVAMYQADPHAFSGTPEQRAKVLGGEACLWAEYVDSSNLISRSWPRGSAVAERLWSSEDINDWTLAVDRIEQHRCRLQARGIHSEPLNGPSSCRCDYVAV